MRKTLIWAVAPVLAASGAAAQQSPPDTQPATNRMDRFEQRLNDLERKYQADLRLRDQEIERLKAQLATRPGPATQPATGESGGEIDKATEQMLQDINKTEAPPPTLRIPASFNPNFAVVSDFLGSYSTDNQNPARNRFDIREVELDLRAAVDPRADAVVILPVSRDVTDPLFFDPRFADGSVNTSIDVEEAYLFLHDFGVPNLTAKLGRFHLRFGRQNILHKHDWPTSDNNFVNQSFLGTESLNDSGVSLSYLVPPNLVGGNYIEADVEVISGEGSTDNPVLNNDASVSHPGLNTHLLWNHDIARDWNIEVGGSYLLGHHNDDSHQWVNLFGSDITLIHTDPTGRFNNQLFQVEAIYGNVDNGRDNPQHSYGAYFLAQEQLNRDWYAGVRLDWTKDALNEHHEVWGISPYLTWYWSEFLRWRVEYQHKAGNTKTEDTVYFQCTFIFGAHPPHPYWAMK